GRAGARRWAGPDAARGWRGGRRGRVRAGGGDAGGGPRRQLEAPERPPVGVGVAAPCARHDANADALAHVACRLLDDAVLERRRLHAAELEIAIGPVGKTLERGPEYALQRAPGEAEAVEDEGLGSRGLHDVAR